MRAQATRRETHERGLNILLLDLGRRTMQKTGKAANAVDSGPFPPGLGRKRDSEIVFGGAYAAVNPRSRQRPDQFDNGVLEVIGGGVRHRACDRRRRVFNLVKEDDRWKASACLTYEVVDLGAKLVFGAIFEGGCKGALHFRQGRQQLV